MSADRRQTAWASASTTSPSATGTRPAASTARFAPCTASGGCAAIAAASAPASASSASSSTSRSHSPMRYASSASMRAAVQISSLALPGPTTRGSRCVPPRSGRMPYLCSSRPDRRAAREHADVARERHLQTGAEREPAHRGDRRVARLLQPGVRLLRAQDAVDRRIAVTGAGVVPALDRVGRASGEHRRVDARRERAPVADHDERAQLGIVAQLLAERAAPATSGS